MRCPNCGNENPDDYTFCDECGAKLHPQDEAAEAGAAAGTGTEAAPSAVAYAATASPAGGPADMQSGSSGADSSGSLGGASAVCPNCGAPVVPGEAYCSECGAELPANLAAAGEASGAAPSMPPYAPAAVEPEAAEAQGEVPVTEETVEAPAAPEAEPAAMPGVTPMAEDAGAAVAMPAVEPGPAPVPVTPAPSGALAIEHVEWANDALEQLDTAQQAMAKGDFIGYGQAMSALKSFLENIAQGAGGQAGVATAGAAPAAYSPGVEAGAAVPAEPAYAPAPVEAAPAAPGGEAAMAEAPAAMPGPGAVGQRAGMARLVVISSGAELPLPQQEEITVGREDPSSGIFPDIDLTPYGGEDGGVSRRHARLLHVGGDYFVEDLQSTNYTKVDGQRLPARVREKLEDGARLDFGRVAVIFRRS